VRNVVSYLEGRNELNCFETKDCGKYLDFGKMWLG
jgi:hypothetical protein